MSSLANKMQVMQLLGTGLSVQTLSDRVNLSYDQLCDLAAEYPDLGIELKRWYPKYDFTVKPKDTKPLETKEKPAKRAKKDKE